MSGISSKARRRFLQASAGSLGFMAMARPSLATSFPATVGDAFVIAAAKAALDRVGARVEQRDLVGVADFSQHSRLPRLHLVDLAGGRVESLFVAHGRGSDPEHTGWLSRFSNEPGSEATSEGAYLTGDYYVGEHGRSMRLIGLDATNSNAEPRGIVVHAAWYVGPEMVQQHGMLGRSEGCLAVSPTDLPSVLGRLGPGRLIVAGRI